MLKMEDDWNGQMGFQDRSSELNSSRSLAEKAVPDIAMNSSHGGRMGSSYGSGWDPIGSPSQGANFGASLMVSHGNFSTPLYPVVSDNMRLRSTSQFMPHYSPVNTNAVEMLPKLSGFGGAGGGSLSGVMDPYGLSGCAQNSGSSNKIIMEPRQSEDDYQISKLTSMEASPTGKRKRNAEGEQERDASNDTSDEKESVKRKKKIEENIDSDQRSKQTDGQTKESSVDGEASKENYVHVRARRGQATNSHSLAERVRREKINDRMKLLQELVPGCNKITGKAVMLDEIINYVQSLQQQVEFLSMKLAAVNPEVNFDIEQILSKDILHSKGTNAPFIGLNLNPGMSSSHLGTTGIHQGALPYHPAPQGMWDGDLQSLLHMGFDLNPNLGPNGSSKT